MNGSAAEPGEPVVSRGESEEAVSQTRWNVDAHPRLVGYDWRETYDWNYAQVPDVTAPLELPAIPGTWQFCGLPVASPLGIPAGPLLNSRWIRYYAALGFDVLTYKTVRSTWRASHPRPNLVPVATTQLATEPGACRVAQAGESFDSWAISFGMPSQAPEIWREDVRRARQALGPGQRLVVSVVASPTDGASMTDIALDYAQCARWAAEAGADAVEANLSCPNVSSAEGDLYRHPSAAAEVVREMRAALGPLPLILKVGLFDDDVSRGAFCESVAEQATAISTTNTIRARVTGPGTAPCFDGQTRGIGGGAIRERCLQELVQWRRLVDAAGGRLQLISVGGVATATDVRRRLNAGAHHVQLATAAMCDPAVAIRIRRDWSRAVRELNGSGDAR
jgi:dihydroorotate dehydrogenase (NAD+) catalytic subunit